MDFLLAKWKNLQNNRGFTHGVPFVLFIVGSSFALREFTTLRYEFRRSEPISSEEFEKLGISKKDPKESTLEKLYEKHKEVDIDNWTNIRGPRPWEDMTEFEKLKEENLAKKKANKLASQ